MDRDVKCIVSFTSYGDRLKVLPEAIGDIIKYPGFHYVFTVYKGDVVNIPDKVLSWVRSELLELIVVDEDYKFHKKYMKAMERYGNDYPIITIDDDWHYVPDLLRALYNAYTETPNYCIGTFAALITFDDKLNFKPYIQWPRIRNVDKDDDLLLLCGCGGVIYPKGFKPIYDFFPNYSLNDDMSLNAAALQQGFHKRVIPFKLEELNSEIVRRTASYPKTRLQNIIDISRYKDTFLAVIQ